MIIPAIDLIDGAVVRLYQGDYNQKTQYTLAPVDVVHSYADQGAEWLHIVDLTGAKDTSKRQLTLIKQMVDTKRMKFQAGGGIRSEQEVAQLLESGVSRVVVGSLAVKETALVKSWVEKYGPEHIVLALDINIDEQGNKFIATHGRKTRVCHWNKSWVSLLKSAQNMFCAPISAATVPCRALTWRCTPKCANSFRQ